MSEDHVCCDGASADLCNVSSDGIGEKDTGKRLPAENKVSFWVLQIFY